MKALSGLALVISVISSPVVIAEKKAVPLCSLYYLKDVKEKVEKESSYDKFKHCAVSCLLARKCPTWDVMELGIIKELADMVGPGNAEWADLNADHVGVQWGKKLRGSNENLCLEVCKKAFPKRTPASLNCKS